MTYWQKQGIETRKQTLKNAMDLLDYTINTGGNIEEATEMCLKSAEILNAFVTELCNEQE